MIESSSNVQVETKFADTFTITFTWRLTRPQVFGRDDHQGIDVMIAYAATTNQITVTAKPLYLDEHSSGMDMRFVFGYFMRIENDSAGEVQLLRRHWHIQEGSGRVQDVDGDGVIGLQPILEPGDVHRYSSYCVLESFTGYMEGSYLMQNERGKRFRITIPRFHLKASSN